MKVVSDQEIVDRLKVELKELEREMVQMELDSNASWERKRKIEMEDKNKRIIPDQ